MPYARSIAAGGALTDSDRLRLALAAGAIVGTWFWDVSADQFTIDEQFAEAFGIDPALGRAGLALEQVIATVHPDDKAQLMVALAEALARGGAYVHQYRVRRRDGSYHWIEANGRVDRDEATGAVTFPGVLLDMDERRALAEERDRAKRLLEAFIEAVPGVVYAKDRQGRMLVANRGTAELVGQPVAAIIGRTDAEFLQDPQEARAITERDAAIMASGRMMVAEEAVRFPDGTPATWLSTKAPFRDEHGEVIGLIGSSIDITERRAIEASLRETEERYRLAAQATNDVIWDWRMADGLVIWNKALEDRLGHAVRETSAQWWLDHIHPDDRQRIDVDIHKVIDGTETAWSAEYRFRRADGSHADVLDHGFVLRTEEGRAIRMIGAVQDLSERRAAEAAVRESEERGRLAAEAAAIGIWDLDLRTGELRWDARTKALFGLAPDQEVTFEGTFLQGLHPDDRERTRAAVEAAIAPGGTGRFAVEHRAIGRDDGQERWIAARGKTLFADDGEPVRFLGTMVDITELKSAEARLRELNETLESRVAREIAERRQAEEALRQSQKMEAVGQLTGGIAHDFNNLLQGITGSLEIVQRRIAQGRLGELDRFIANACAAANRAAALTHRLLAFSRRQPLDPKPVCANTLIASMEDLFRRTIGENVALDFQLAPDPWITRCDPNQLENAVLNLVINARDAMPAGGRLTIETRNVHLDGADLARQQGMKPGHYVCVRVTDTGVGMDEVTLAKAFEPFFTTKPIGQGTGLGLSMIYGFAQQSEGYAQLHSEPGRGTTFELYLPRHCVEAEEGETPAELDRTRRADAAEVVLVVEDEAVVRGLIVEELKDLGYRPIEARDSAEGLDVLRSKRRIDLMVTDIGLPGLNGRQLADAARELRPDLKILLMTGYAQDAAPAAGFLEPGMQMITKPFAMAALASRMRAMIEGDGWVSGPLY